jgi:hypothetical protein
MRTRSSIALLAPLVLLAGCAAQNPAQNPASGAAVPGAPGCQRYARTELFFGTDRPGGAVSDQEFHAFTDAEITPRFPDGLTLLPGTGQFRGADGKLVAERSMVLILLYPVRAESDSGAKIEQIRELYKKKFSQESVLRVDEPDPSCVAF